MVIIVEKGESIQAAIDSAKPGDTVLVKAGIYREDLDISEGKDRLRLIGAGKGKTIIDGKGLPAIAGISVTDSDFVTLAGLTIRNFLSDGIRLSSNDNVVRNNEITANEENGLRIDGSRNLIRENVLDKNGQDGARLGGGMLNYIIENRISENRGAGVAIESACPYTLLLENEIRRNRSDGIDVRAAGCWIVRNKLFGNRDDGIDVGSAPNVLLWGNTCRENKQNGIEVDAEGLVALGNRLFANKNDGVKVSLNASENTVDAGLQASIFFENKLRENVQAGFDGWSNLVSHNLFLSNDINKNGRDGLDLKGGNFNRLLFNRIDENKIAGIEVGGDASGNVIDDNRLTLSRANGIRLSGLSTANTLRANKLKKNRSTDIHAEPPANVNNTLDLNE